MPAPPLSGTAPESTSGNVYERAMPVTYAIATGNGTATAGSDYANIGGKSGLSANRDQLSQ